MRSLIRKILNKVVRSYIAQYESSKSALGFHQTISYIKDQPPILIYALIQGRRFTRETLPKELQKRIAGLVIDAAFKTKRQLIPDIHQLGSFSCSKRLSLNKPAPAIFVTNHHGYVALMMVYLQSKGYQCSLVAADPCFQREFATTVWGANQDLDVFKPDENVLIEIRRRLKDSFSVMLCVDYGLPAPTRKTTPQTLISGAGFACAKKLGAEVVFAHAALNELGHLDFFLEDYGRVRDTPLSAAQDYLRWLNTLDTTTRSWMVTERVVR